MVRRTLLVVGTVAGIVILGLAVWIGTRPPSPATLHISGDGSDAVRALLPGVDYATAPEASRVEAILLRRMENVRHVPGLEALCRGRCEGQGVTAFLRLVPGHARKTVVIDIGRMGAGATLDDGAPLDADVAACAAQVVVAELSRLRAASPPCAGARRQIAVLPWGL